MKKYIFIIFLIPFVGFSSVNGTKTSHFSENNSATKISEEEKIKLLISYVRGLKGATFFRNGAEHTPEEAASHLELKRKKAGTKVKTAVEFIVFCASKSSTSGKDYTIKLSDGKTYKSMDLLLEELKKIEKEHQ